MVIGAHRVDSGFNRIMILIACLTVLANCGKSEPQEAAPTCEEVAKNTHGLSLTSEEAVEFVKTCNADAKKFDAKARVCLVAAKELEAARRCLGREPGDDRIATADCERVLGRLIQRLEENAADEGKDISAPVAAVTKRREECASATFNGATANCLNAADTFSDALECKAAAIGATAPTGTPPAPLAKPAEGRPRLSNKAIVASLRGRHIGPPGAGYPVTEGALKIHRIVEETYDGEHAVVVIDMEMAFGRFGDPAVLSGPLKLRYSWRAEWVLTETVGDDLRLAVGKPKDTMEAKGGTTGTIAGEAKKAPEAKPEGKQMPEATDATGSLTVVGIEPATGIDAGGTRITLHGSGFVGRSAKVYFGS